MKYLFFGLVLSFGLFGCSAFREAVPGVHKLTLSTFPYGDKQAAVDLRSKSAKELSDRLRRIRLRPMPRGSYNLAFVLTENYSVRDYYFDKHLQLWNPRDYMKPAEALQIAGLIRLLFPKVVNGPLVPKEWKIDAERGLGNK